MRCFCSFRIQSRKRSASPSGSRCLFLECDASWILIPSLPIKLAPVGVLRALAAIGAPGSPLLEEVRDASVLALLLDASGPLALHRARLRPALPTNYDPMNISKVEVAQILEQ